MARRVFMHVGTPKSGTTYLQSVWWANKEELLEQRLLLPGRGVNHHYWASCVVRGGRQLDHIPAVGHQAWDQLLEEVERFSGDALISHELFSPAPEERVEEALRRLAMVGQEIHVVLTARDLARQVPAEWQQRTKHGNVQGYADFLDMIERDPTVNFWRVQDVPAVLERWGAGLPDERVHLVVLPPPGGPRTFLWDQLCQVTGVDGEGMTERASRSNESLGLVEAETMRRVNEKLHEHGFSKATSRLLKDFFAEQMLRSSNPERIVLPAQAHPWVVERAQQMVDQLRGRHYDVRGDLAHLVPADAPAAGRQVEEVGDHEVAEVAVRTLARFVRHEEVTRRRQRTRARRAWVEHVPFGAGAAVVWRRLRAAATRS